MSLPAFALPRRLEADAPPETRGLARDRVRLLVARRSGDEIEHARFSDLPHLLSPGDLIVVNVSATIPAAVPARRSDGTAVRAHFSTPVPRLDDRWRAVELRTADGRPLRRAPGERLALPEGGTLELAAPYAAGPRLMVARLDTELPLLEYLERHGEPIRYRYASHAWPLETYQNVYATTPGSSEMPSAGRPFTPRLITALAARGVLIAPIVLHCGVSSLEHDEPPFAEPYEVSVETARLIGAVRRWGGRVIAVGTTVVRALETVALPGGAVRAGTGWTNLVITPERGVRAVDGLITGWHEPEASHLRLLEAVAGADLLERSYESALEAGYLWHEFGDSHLIFR